MNTEGNSGPGRVLRRRASVVAVGLCAWHRLLPDSAFVVLLNQVTAHTAAGFGLTCVFPGKLLAENGHSWVHWNCERAGGQGPDASLRVSLLSRGDHSSSTLRRGCPAPREPSVVCELHPAFLVKRDSGLLQTYPAYATWRHKNKSPYQVQSADANVRGSRMKFFH